MIRFFEEFKFELKEEGWNKVNLKREEGEFEEIVDIICGRSENGMCKYVEEG